MHEIEKWIDDLYEKRIKLDRESVRIFIKNELRLSPMEDVNLALNIILGKIHLDAQYYDIGLLEVFKYRKELREKEEREKCVISNKCRECDNIAYYRGNDKIAVCLHDSFRPQAPLITEDLKCPKEVEE